MRLRFAEGRFQRGVRDAWHPFDPADHDRARRSDPLESRGQLCRGHGGRGAGDKVVHEEDTARSDLGEPAGEVVVQREPDGLARLAATGHIVAGSPRDRAHASAAAATSALPRATDTLARVPRR